MLKNVLFRAIIVRFHKQRFPLWRLNSKQIFNRNDLNNWHSKGAFWTFGCQKNITCYHHYSPSEPPQTIQTKGKLCTRCTQHTDYPQQCWVGRKLALSSNLLEPAINWIVVQYQLRRRAKTRQIDVPHKFQLPSAWYNDKEITACHTKDLLNDKGKL
jgi:hypothetical protein